MRVVLERTLSGVFFAALIVVLLVTATGCGERQVAPQMKTETNERYGFEITYDAARFKKQRTSEHDAPLGAGSSMKIYESTLVNNGRTDAGGPVTGVGIAAVRVAMPQIPAEQGVRDVEAQWRERAIAGLGGAQVESTQQVRFGGGVANVSDFSGRDPDGTQFTCRLYSLHAANRIWVVVLQAPSEEWAAVRPELERVASTFSIRTLGAQTRADALNAYFRDVREWQSTLAAHMPKGRSGGWSSLMHPALRPPAVALGGAMDDVESVLERLRQYWPLGYMRSAHKELAEAVRLMRRERYAQIRGNFQWPSGSYVYDQRAAEHNAGVARGLLRSWIRVAEFWAGQLGVKVPHGLFDM